MQENERVFDTSRGAVTPSAAFALVEEFMRLAVEAADPEAAKGLMTRRSADVKAFDPRGLADADYVIHDAIVESGMVIVPVELADVSGQQATAPLIVVLEDGQPRIDVAATVELMTGAQVQIVDDLVKREISEQDPDGGTNEE